jgi:hypothetical protein
MSRELEKSAPLPVSSQLNRSCLMIIVRQSTRIFI